MHEHVGHRNDLGYLVATAGGELVVGHSYLTGPGDEPADTPVSVGMLGADYGVENGRYRIKKVLTGENWIVDEDEGPIGVQIFGEEGNFLTIFATEGTSIRSCTNTQIDITEGSAFTDFVEVEDIDLPETSDDIRAILFEGT